MYNKEELDKMAKKGEELLKRESHTRGYEYISAAGKKIVCNHCGSEFFLLSNALLNTRWMTYFGLDWLNEKATILVCTECGHIHWFSKNVDRYEV